MLVKVKVHPNSKKEKIQKLAESEFEIWVREKAENNLANGRVISAIAGHFGVSDSKIRVVKGRHFPNKILTIDI